MIKYIYSLLIVLLSWSCQVQDQENKSVKKESETTPTDTSVLKKGGLIHPFNAPIIPDKVTFAGEKVPVSDPSIAERLDRELLINNFWHTRTFLTIKRAHRWFPTIERVLKQYDVPEDFKYLAVAESGLEHVVSPANAVGFWQFLKRTGKDYGLEVNRFVDERYHVEKSTIAACKYLINAKKKLGSWTLAAAAYNRGKAGIENNLEDQQTDSYYDLHLNEETSRYLFRIIATKLILSNPEKYGFNIPASTLYKPYRTKVVTVSEDINDLAEFARTHQTTYKLLKLLNPWLRNSSLKVSAPKTYEILIPSNESSLKVHGNA